MSYEGNRAVNDEHGMSFWERMQKYFLQLERGELTQNDILQTNRTDCLSVLVDIKGAYSNLQQNEAAYVQRMNRFYYIFESWLGWRGKNFGEHMAMTFGDSFYLEAYNPDAPRVKTWCRHAHPGAEIKEMLCEIFNLVSNTEQEGFLIRTYISRGYTYRRVFQNDVVLPLAADHILKPTVIHLFGFGDSMMRVFDAVESQFKGEIFIDEALFLSLSPPLKNKGIFVARRTRARFVCIV